MQINKEISLTKCQWDGGAAIEIKTQRQKEGEKKEWRKEGRKLHAFYQIIIWYLIFIYSII